MEQKREKFSSSLTVFFATLSSAVGLGNIWMFPYVVGQNGGAAFIIVYLGCVLLIGLPTLISEFVVGRGTRKNVCGAISKVTDKRRFKSIGYIAVLSTSCMLFFYTVVAGWVYSYVFKALFGVLKGVTAEEAAQIFNSTSLGPIAPIIWQIIVLVVAGSILGMGVKSGIEKLTKVLMPILIGLLILCVLRSLTLPGAYSGIEFLLKPDFSKVTIGVVLSALGLAFFKLSVGTGTMVTYGSYFTEDNDLIGTAGKVAIADTGVSLLAGLAIFPAVFSFGLAPTEGPGLLFNTVPLIFAKMPGGSILSIIFFGLTAMAATMATISLLEVLIALFTEELKISRKKSLIINISIIVLIGSLAALSANPDGVLAHIKIFGFTIFDSFDKFVSNILLPINGLLVILLLGYGLSKDFIIEQLTNKGTLKNQKVVSLLMFIIKYVTPILILIVFIKSFI
ncbi:sodium-dependent transporter [Clostridium paraputrificum]|uniref:sodium-dependent transporter n=1 Tax=Clostridium paraputrificum TaxID=29363 RepID=UPI00325BF1FE